MSSIQPHELERVLRRSKDKDDAGRRIAGAIALIERVLQDIGEEALAISFNGGKDCTVLLHIYAAILYARHQHQPGHIPSASHVEPTSSNPSSSIPRISPATSNGSTAIIPPPETDPYPISTPSPYPPMRSIYITAPNPFPALEEFVATSATAYNMRLVRFGGRGMKVALEDYLGCDEGKGVKGMLMGTRKGDPNGDVEPIAPTDPSWPPLLRVHPILDWSYADVWTFLREFDVPYCSLYDQGYTSLGSTTNTVPNPLLRIPPDTMALDAESEKERYAPAWTLTDGSKERCGRLDRSV